MSDTDPQETDGNPVEAEAEAEQNVDKIREILFGGQMRDYQRRFQELETSLNSASERLRQDFGNRLDSIETFMRREIELLGERLVSERGERGEERDQLETDLAETRRRLEDALNRLDAQSANEARSIRAALQEKSAELANLIQHSRDDFNAVLARHANSLEDRKLSREDLAGMLSELALRLNRELDLPSD